MKVKFSRWGNSLALRVPKAFAQEIGAAVGKAANMEIRDGKLVVEIVKPRRRRYMERLVAGICPVNRIGRDRALTIDDRGDSVHWYVDLPRQFSGGNAEFLLLFGEMLAGVNRGTCHGAS